ncbi:MAG: CopD family protein [Gammaproteobacteria bacterium]|nr:CopD family protein [Gammaproteobacteria bacterium]
MGSYYLWLKGLHIAFMVTWFAGLFYLPRLFIYHAPALDAPSRERFGTMEYRLFVIMTLGAGLTALFGIGMLLVNPALLGQGWFQLKLLAVAGLAVYHYRCYRWIVVLRSAAASQDTRWLRWFNEIPVIFLLGGVLLAVLKPSFGS